MAAPADATTKGQALALLAAAKNHGDLAVKLSSLKEVKEILLSLEPSLSAEIFPYLRELCLSPEVLVRRSLIEIIEEVGLRMLEHSYVLVSVLIHLVGDNDPTVAEKSISTGTTFFRSILEKMETQFHHHGKVDRWCVNLWTLMVMFKDAVFNIALDLEPGRVVGSTAAVCQVSFTGQPAVVSIAESVKHILEVFPTLSSLPVQLRDHLQQMIHWLDEAIIGDMLPLYERRNDMRQVLDRDRRLRCLFKRFYDEDRARNEAIAYLLDHPEDGHRSQSEQIYGFSRVRPAVWVRCRIKNQVKMGVLIEFLESSVTVQSLEPRNGSAAHLVPIDHELSFFNDAHPYITCGACWIKWLKKIDKDFLRSWYIENFTVFATFLKKAVSQGLTALQIGLLASYKWEEDLDYNLHCIVASVQREDNNFVESVGTRIEQRLREFHENLHGNA
ncbi:Armadillo-type fold [Arabidopsis thaliana x Arabidopsis arenosa]|uniref:Armadillo-type fold n=1 Tax=Arabidopsis thaliana x Arabidopsis arenosa TaxID=1240361 RepID=A0A8T1X9L1_9BRAS|nr:Armadillo-type fold [Arabidopsis thaliana x Arabidopsis arenosa]